LTAYEASSTPQSRRSQGAKRRIEFLQRATAQLPDAVAAADVEVLQQNVAGAFDRLITLIKRTAGDERTKVRERLIELFDPADPEVIAGRRKLANALY
jgi:putative thioredoxin